MLDDEVWTDAQELFGSLPESVMHMNESQLSNYLIVHPEARSALVDFVRTNFPSRSFVPNVGQEKAILPLKTLDINSDELIVGSFCGGNGVGKTTMIPQMIIGAAWGKKELNPFFANWTVFDKFEKIRTEERRPLLIRIVCDSSQMEENGGLFKEIKKWIPKGRVIWAKDKASYWKRGTLYKTSSSSKNDKIVAEIQVRTFQQEARVHAGDNVDLTLINEPMPEHLFSENVGRLRTRHGGILWIFATPLAEGSWIKDKIADDPIHAANFTSAPLWDNCSDWHPDPAMWDSGVVGIGHVLTRGRIPRAVFLGQIREWEKEGKDVANARINGAFTHFAGVVLKEFSEDAHVIDSFDIPRDWPIYCVMDPHNGGKPNYITWWAQSPEEKFYCIGEYPNEDWESAKNVESTQRCCQSIREIESKISNQVIYRISDPVIAKFHRENGDKIITLQQEFASNGMFFSLANNDTGVGMSKLRDLLIFDKTHEVDDWNTPHLFIFRNSFITGRPIRNTARAFMEWTYKEGYESKDSGVSFDRIVTQRWKDPVDTARYLAISRHPFRRVPPKGAFSNFAPRPEIDRSPRDW